MSQLGIPVNIEKSDINSSLNASLLIAFGLGIYAVIYFGTMYIYFTRGPSKSYIVPATITLLFLCNVVLTSVQWYGTKLVFVNNGGMRDSIFAVLFHSPHWVSLLIDITSFTSFVLADGLLIWRCFFAWNRSFRVILVSLLLVITEIALFFVQIVFSALYGNAPPNATLQGRINDLLSASFFITFATTLITTVLIAYRIHYASRQGVSAKRFKRIIDIVVQSGALCSPLVLLTALSGVLPGANIVTNTWGVAFAYYTEALVSTTTGVSATILVARVSMLPTDTTFPSTSVHLSGLQFHARSTHHTDMPEEIENCRAVDVDDNPVEGQRVEEKAQ